MKPILYLNAYYRDDHGAWRYAANDELVPDAYDVETVSLTEGGMGAPELLISTMLDQSGLARLLGVKTGTIHTMKHRNNLPPPQYDNGKTALWSVPVIRFWMEAMYENHRDSLGRRKVKR